MNLYFVRHAEPDYINDTITEYGKVQAEKLADWFCDIHVDELYHSSMGRAEITASFLAKKCGVDAKSIDWARELRWGKSNGDAKDPLSPWTIKDKILEANHSYPNGDDWKNLSEFEGDNLISDIEIHCNALDEFLIQHGYVRDGQFYKAVEPNDKTVVIVCHGGVISALIAYLANASFFKYISHMGVDLTAVTKINFCGMKDDINPAHIVYVNNQSHLGMK